MDSTNDGIWMWEKTYINFVKEDGYFRPFLGSFDFHCKDWHRYKKCSIRLAPKELMVWKNE